MKELHCGEVGFFPDCEGVIRGETEEEVLQKAAAHGKEIHGMTDADLDESAVAQVRAHIRDA